MNFLIRGSIYHPFENCLFSLAYLQNTFLNFLIVFMLNVIQKISQFISKTNPIKKIYFSYLESNLFQKIKLIVKKIKQKAKFFRSVKKKKKGTETKTKQKLNEKNNKERKK